MSDKEKELQDRIDELQGQLNDVNYIIEGLVNALSEGHKHFPKPKNKKEEDALEDMAWNLYVYTHWKSTGEFL